MIAHTMQKALQALLILSLGVGIGWWLKPPPKPSVRLVEVFMPATDQQLMSFWFGSGDKAKLRKRVCGK
jgi:hypothetical protein